ncbi:spore coat protein [Desulfosporosinus sp.]|uniref:spore coat protein n=1 Tax=Desulfosporosinus sp. TaxID=157907 RepID=UPI0025B9E862|nr:spore coat protein [Desulfosporosinus sp.]
MNYEKKPINAIKKPMSNDYLEIENSDGMPGLVDSTIALNFLLTAKSGIRNCAVALTEIADPEARTEVRKMLNVAIDLHAEISNLMMKKGWFQPYQVSEQFKLDKMSAQAALQIANMQLFPGDTSRLGTFATPNY